MILLINQCSYQYFLEIWSKDEKLKMIKVPKVKRFTQCDTCNTMNQQQKETRDGWKRDRIRLEHDIHLMMQATERHQYVKHGEVSR